MSPSRSLIRRRKSSLAGLVQIKAGNYGINTNSSPRALTFAPNVTPGTYVEADDDVNGESTPPLPSTALFPPTEPNPAPTRRRLPPGKRLSQGYIPRPPNAFMLFRANFVRQKHVPGSIETNHGSLSKIIGNCWRALPLEEKKHWEFEAKKAKAAHREKWPNYRFRPVHNKNKKKGDATAVPSGPIVPVDKRKDKLLPQPADEERCEFVAQLLLEGKKGEELAEAVRQIDLARAMSRPESAEPLHQQHDFTQPPPNQFYLQRRPSSVPPPTTLYNAANIALPTLPFLVAPTAQAPFDPNGLFNPAYNMASTSAHVSRAPSPVGNIARNRAILGLRRASSVQPIPSERMWDGFDPHLHPMYQQSYGHQQQQQQGLPPMPAAWQLQPDWEPLPEVTDTSIFQPGWTNSFKDSGVEPAAPFHPNMAQVSYLAPDESVPPSHQLHLNIGPLDSFDFASPPPSTVTEGYTPEATGMYEPVDPHATWPVPESGPSSAFSGSPARSDASLPPHIAMHVGHIDAHQQQQQVAVMCAPQPQHPQVAFDAWVGSEHDVDKMHQHMQHQLEQAQLHHQHQQEVEAAQQHQQQQYISALPEDGYAAQYDMYADVGMDMDMGMASGVPVAVGVDYGYCTSQDY